MSARLRHYACGSTSHGLGAMFRDVPHEERTFPSGAFLYDGGAGRRVLFDTGYAPGRWRTGWRGAVYRRLLPPRVSDGDDIAVQLAQDGVDPASVTHVVLSHLHPDHVGGVRHFPQATFVLTDGLVRTLSHPRLRTGVLPGLLPDWFASARRRVLDPPAFGDVAVRGARLRGVDLFADGSYVVVELPGHADGHVGALVDGEVLLAGDAAWGHDLLAATARMRMLPRAVQHDAASYLHTAALLSALDEAGVRVVCSHDAWQQRELLP